MGKMNLTESEREQLQSILMLEDGVSRDAMMSQLEYDSRFIARWSERFMKDRLAGMYARHPGREPVQPTAKLEARE